MIRILRKSIHCVVFFLLSLFLIIGVTWLSTGSITLRQSWLIPFWKTIDLGELDLQFSSVTLFVDGTIEIGNPAITISGEQDPVFAADTARTNFSLQALWEGTDSLRRLEFNNGRIFIARIYSPTGEQYPVMRYLSLTLVRENADNLWQLHLRGKMGSLRIELVGEGLSLDLLRSEETETPTTARTEVAAAPESEVSLRQQFNQFSQKWSHALPWLQSVGDGDLHAILKQNDKRQLVLDTVTFQAKEIQHPEWGKIQLLEAEIHNAYPFELIPPQSGLLRISQYHGHFPNLPSAVEVEEASLRFHYLQKNSIYRVDCFLNEISWRDYRIDSLYSHNRWNIEQSLLDFSLHLTRDDQSLSVHYNGNPFPNLQGVITGSGTLDPMVWIEASGQEWSKALKWQSPPEKVYSYFKFEIGEQEQLNSAYFAIKARDFHWENLPECNLLETSGKWNNGQIQLDNFTMAGDGFSLNGEGWIHPEQKRFSLYVNGLLDPLPWSPELPAWWLHTWESFQLTKEDLPELQLHASGSWNEPRPEFKVSGSLNVQNFHYRGIPVKKLSVGLEFKPGFLWLRDLTIVTPNGAGRGNVWRHEAVPFDGVSQFFFDVQSRIPPADLARLIDKEVEDIVSHTQFSGSTFIHGQGSLFTGKPPFLQNADFTLLIVSEHPLSVDSIPLSWISTQAHIQNGLIQLKNLTAQMANGLLQGEATGYFLENPERFTLDARLDNADLIPFLSIWKKEQDTETAATETDGNNDTPSPLNSGILDLNIHLQGPWKQWGNLNGVGSFLITEGHFQKINLLGFLSNILPITTIEFDEVKSNFVWSGDKLEFPKLEAIGPTTTIHASGYYLFSSSEIDFVTKVYYLEKAPLLKILSPIFQPFAHLLEVRLWGKFSDPQWRFILDPRNLFSL